MPVINAVQTADSYPANQPGTIISQVFNSRGGWFSVSGAAVFCEMQYGPQGSGDLWTEEVELGDGAFAFLDPKCTGVRFRSAKSGTPATITAQIAQGDEPPLSIVALGSLSVVGLSLTFQHNDVAAGSEPIADFEDAAGVLTWTLTDDVANTRMKITPSFPDPVLAPGSLGWGGKSSNAVGVGPGGFLDSSGRVLVVRTANSSPTIGTGLTTDTFWRFQTDTGGLLQWGSGTGASDTSLGRTASGTLTATALQWNFAVNGGTSGVVISTGGSGNALRVFTSGDANPRFGIDFAGSHSWGAGGASAVDTTLSRSSAVPPSSGQVGLSTQQAFYSTNTTGGFVYAAASNNAALLSFAAASDANPMFKIFTQGALLWGPGGASGGDVELARITNAPSGTGSFLELIAGDGFGYGTGTGGTVTQATSFSTGVTLNKPNGKITLFTSAISAGLLISFTVTCSQCGIDDHVILTGDNMAGVVMSASVAAGSFTITWFSSGSLASATRKINYCLVKGAVA